MFQPPPRGACGVYAVRCRSDSVGSLVRSFVRLKFMDGSVARRKKEKEEREEGKSSREERKATVITVLILSFPPGASYLPRDGEPYKARRISRADRREIVPRLKHTG